MFPELNRERLRFLFYAGVSRARIKRFLDDRKASLVMHGAQYQRRGRGAEADLTFLIGLPEKCIPTVRAWIADGFKADPELHPEALISQFAAIENSGEKLTPASAESFAAQGLSYLFHSKPPESWLRFLGTSIGPNNAALNVKASLPAETSSAACIGAKDGELAGALTELLRKLREDDSAGARQSLARVPAGEVRIELEELVTRHRAHMRDSMDQPRALRELDSTEGLDPERVAVLLRRTRHASPGQPVFLEICGLYLDRELYTLSEEQSFELFEHRHHIIAFPDKAARLPVQGELSLWYVQKYPTDKPIKYRLRKPAAALHVLVPLAASIDEFGQVRTAIQNASFETWMRPIFGLSSGGYLRMTTDTPYPVRTNLEQPLQYHRSLAVWNAIGMSVVIDPMPPADGEYDCADLSVVTARILRDSDARRQLPSLSKAQVSSLIEALRASDMGLTEQRLVRIAQEFERYVDSAERLEQVSAHILESKPVAAVIESAKRGAIEQWRAENQQLRDERTRLEREIGELKQRRSTVLAENKQTAEEIRGVVRKTFEKAKEAGVKSLGELAVFSALMEGRSAENYGIDDAANGIALSFAERKADAQSALIGVGVSIPNARVIATAAKRIASRGLPLLVVGVHAAQVASALGIGLAESRCMIGDVSVGVVNSEATKRILELSTPTDAIVLRNHNLSAFEAYGSHLMDALLSAIVASQPIRSAVVLSVARGVAALPVDEDLRSLAVVVDASVDLIAHTSELSFILEQLRDDRGVTRTRSTSLARLLEGLDDALPNESDALLALIAVQEPLFLSARPVNDNAP